MGRGYYNDYRESYWRPYVSAAERKQQSLAAKRALEKQGGRPLEPVAIEGLKIAKSVWGNAWCVNLESYSDFSNRLPRGRTYVRNGSVIDLMISAGQINARVMGSDLYEQTISIKPLETKCWQKICNDCTQSIHSIMDLLQGRFDKGVMERLSRPREGLFPQPREIQMTCSCPDYASLCKHLAAVLYGVGARLDHRPELLFTLRKVDHLELVSQVVAADSLQQSLAGDADQALDADNLGAMFGIELDSLAETESKPAQRKRASTVRSSKQPALAPRRAERTPARKKPVKKKSALKAAANKVQAASSTGTTKAAVKKPKKSAPVPRQVQAPSQSPTAAPRAAKKKAARPKPRAKANKK